MSNGQSLLIVSSDNAVLAQSLDLLEASVTSAARTAVDAAIVGTGEAYTELELRAMTVTEALKLTNHVELASIRLRGRYIHFIREEGLDGAHPGGFSSLEQLAAEQGISAGELSQTITLCDVIFPFLEANGVSVAEIWNSVRKSTFREMAPALSALITGNMPNTASALAAVQRLMDDQQASAVASGEINSNQRLNDLEIRTRAALDLINFAGTTTNRAVRERLRPLRTEPINTVIIEDGDIAFVLMACGPAQRDLLFRQMNTNVSASVFNTNNTEVQASTQPIRRLLGM